MACVFIPSITWLPSRAGYDCEFVSDRPPDADCSICKLIIRHPHQVTCCGETFCESCIEPVKNEGECPNCEKRGFTTFEDKSLKRVLTNYHVYCEKKKEGCKWEGELGDLEKHLNEFESPPQNLEKQLGGCQFVDINCLYCHVTCKRYSISTHQKHLCYQRPHKCEYCGHKGTYEEVILHHQTCLAFPIPCPNGCDLILKRSECEHHVSKECTLRMVKCGFHEMGCSAEVAEKDLQAHMSEQFEAHSLLVAQFTEKAVADAKTELNTLLSSMQEKNRKLETNLHRLASLETRLYSLEEQNKGLKYARKTMERRLICLCIGLSVVIILAALCLGLAPIKRDIRIEDKLNERVEKLERNCGITNTFIDSWNSFVFFIREKYGIFGVSLDNHLQCLDHVN